MGDARSTYAAAGAATPGSYSSSIGKYATGDATGSSAAHGLTPLSLCRFVNKYPE